MAADGRDSSGVIGYAAGAVPDASQPRWSLLSGMILQTALDPADSVARYQGSGVPKGAVMLVVLALLYVLPSMLAWKRGSSRRWKVLLINVLLGWTVIGWIVALVLTYAYEEPPEGAGPDTAHVPGSVSRR